MQITEVKVGELIDFIESEQFKQFQPKPITELRAVSQFNNPDAKAEDTALIIAHENAQVIGFAGLLPRNTNGSALHVCSNTCWWADSKKGKGIALPLLFSALKKYDSQMYLTDCPPYTNLILEKTGHFIFYEPRKGIRGIMRFYFADIFTKKHKSLKKLKGIFTFVDLILNFLWSPFYYRFLKKYQEHQLDFIPVNSVNKEIEMFVKTHSENEFIGKSSAILEWIKKYPWVTESIKKEPYEYPFSHQVKKYELEYFELRKNGKLKAFVAFSIRDNLAKLPFLYFDNNNLEEVMYSIYWYILKKKYDSIIVFHPAIVSFLKVNKLPFIYKKNELKIVGTTKVLQNSFSEKPLFQDGDGDVIFT